MNLALFGIGAQLSEDYGFCTIRELLPGGPAMKSKQLKPDDRIVAVAQGDKPPVDVVNMDLGKVVQQIRGPKGTEVRLTVIPAEDRGARRVVALIRDEIKLEDKEAKAQLIEFPDGQRLGIIDLPSFYAPVNDGSGARTTPKYTSADVTKLLERLKKEKVQGVILDLRSNPGGSLEEAVRFTGLFIKDGPVVQARDSASHITIDSDPDPNIVYGGPLVVLLNRFSASASEIAAAALQDYGRAVVVGDVSTHGKGTVQQLQQLRPFVWPANSNATNDPGMLKITKGKFYRVSGASTQLKGVASDIVLPDILNHSSTIGEEALENALAWDTIQPARYDKLNLVEPFLAELQSRSQARVATNQEFAYIKQDIELFKKNQADKTASLNEREVIADRERDTLKNRDREKERDVRPLPTVKIYEITVKNSDDDELPAPKSWFATNIVTAIMPTNWPAGTISISLTNTFAGGSTNYFGTLPALPTAATNLVTDARLTDNSTNCATIKATINKSVPQDPVLEEGENILRDYISILAKNGMLTITH
jgi:carboxyl-terminal processing protease